MAVDEGLLHGVTRERAFLRLYRWSPACLSFGRNEPAARRYGRARVTSTGVATVRRPTGGRAVWHAEELTYAIAGPVTVFGSLRDTYISIHRVLASGLRRIGVPATLAGPSRVSLDSGGCFQAAVAGELLVDDRKLCGSAQVREGDAFLQHGSLLLANRQERIHTFAGGVAPKAVALDEVVGHTVTFAEVADAIVTSAQAIWGGSWTATTFSAPETLLARYRDPNWTWRR